jgi:hypothetical protein
VAALSLMGAFLAFFDGFLEFREALHDLREGIRRFFLAAAVAFLSIGSFPTETLL